MVCLHPKIAYQRKFMPINGDYSEKNLKRLNKISFSYKEGWTQIELPCGECPACKLEKANEWATRINCETETWQGKGIFVTLTYNNEKLPKTEQGLMTLKKRDMQLYKKRLRKYIAKNNEACHYWQNPKTGKIEKPIRTFECGEYGPKGGRPHYHQIIFNWIPNDLKFDKMSEDGFPLYKSKTLQKIWGNGFVLIGMISYESASYVARYTMKKNGLAKTKRKYYDCQEIDKETGEIIIKTKYKTIKGIIEPEFITMSTSPGIGYNYFMENIEKIKENNCIMIKAKAGLKLKKIPRYFRKLWEKKDWIDYEKWKYKMREEQKIKNEEEIKKYNLPENWQKWKKENWVKIQTIERIKHKFKLLKRDKYLYGNDEDNYKNVA